MRLPGRRFSLHVRRPLRLCRPARSIQGRGAPQAAYVRTRLGMTSRTARDRPHSGPRRPHQLYLRCSPAELDAISSAAARAGLTPGGYAAEAALAAAQGTEPPLQDSVRQVLIELMQARIQLRRYGINVSHAIAALNTIGQPPEWLREAAALADSAVARLEPDCCEPRPSLASSRPML